MIAPEESSPKTTNVQVCCEEMCRNMLVKRVELLQRSTNLMLEKKQNRFQKKFVTAQTKAGCLLQSMQNESANRADGAHMNRAEMFCTKKRNPLFFMKILLGVRSVLAEILHGLSMNCPIRAEFVGR